MKLVESEMKIGDRYECRNGMIVEYAGYDTHSLYRFWSYKWSGDDEYGPFQMTTDENGIQSRMMGNRSAYDVVKRIEVSE